MAAIIPGVLLTVHQPAYLPWLGYLDKIDRADVFVYYDDVQFSSGSFINRNYVKTPAGRLLLTVPVTKRSTIRETLVADDGWRWAVRHLKTIRAAYARAPFFEQLFPSLEKLYAIRELRLDELCLEHLRFWLTWLDIETTIVRSSWLNAGGDDKSARLIEICDELGADRYLAGGGARDYLDVDAFARAGIEVVWQDFIHPEYPQLWGAFAPGMGVVDYCMNARAREQAPHRGRLRQAIEALDQAPAIFEPGESEDLLR